MGQVWGWGYGGEGQLGLGSRIKMVASPHLIPCIDPSSNGGAGSGVRNQKKFGPAAEQQKPIGNYIKSIACGGRHSVVVTGNKEVLSNMWMPYSPSDNFFPFAFRCWSAPCLWLGSLWTGDSLLHNVYYMHWFGHGFS